jgi:hypothetical protein
MFAAYAAWRRSARVAVGYTRVMSQHPLNGSTLLAIARAADLPLASEADATRVAAGAQAVIDAVCQMQHLELFDYEPADFLRTLEQLAAPDGTQR